ncbi:MAG TPA: OmpH family outer membrane protein [Fimbriimonadaceae bacterium]
MKINVSNLGWIIAVGLAAIMLGSGFQSPTLKVGTADLEKVMSSSDYWISNESTYNDYVKKRSDFLQFFNQNRMMTTSEVTKMKELSLADNPTAQQKSDLDKLKSQVTDEQKSEQELGLKSNLTPDERAKLTEFNSRETANGQDLQNLNQQFTQDISDKKASIISAAMDKAKLAVQTVGRAQGFTVVLSTAAAPYSANDITTDAIKSMNAQK